LLLFRVLRRFKANSVLKFIRGLKEQNSFGKKVIEKKFLFFGKDMCKDFYYKQHEYDQIKFTFFSSYFTKKKFEICVLVPAPLVGALLLYFSLRGWLVAAGTAAGWVSLHLAWYYLGGGRVVYRLVAAGTAAGWVSLHLAWYYLGVGRFSLYTVLKYYNQENFLISFVFFKTI
jgi:hypothetical protein